MVYRKHTQKSRSYKRKGHSHSDDTIHKIEPTVTRPVLALAEHASNPQNTRSENRSMPLGFLNSIFGSKSSSEKSLFKILDYDICLDDLLLIGLIALLLTDKMHDEILLFVLLYLLLDIF